MTIKHAVTCDGCGKDNLWGRPHIGAALMPPLPGYRQLHFCSHDCIDKYAVNLTTIFGEFTAAHRAIRAAKAGNHSSIMTT